MIGVGATTHPCESSAMDDEEKNAAHAAEMQRFFNIYTGKKKRDFICSGPVVSESCAVGSS